jgi:hypothetical protein
MEKDELTPAEIEDRARELARRVMQKPAQPHEWPRQPKAPKAPVVSAKRGKLVPTDEAS